MFSKQFWAYQFVSVVVTSTRFDVQNNSEYSRGLMGSSKPTFMPGVPVNGKCGRLAPDCPFVVLHATVVTEIFFFIRADTLFTT
jgi:hypothetical protein